MKLLQTFSILISFVLVTSEALVTMDRRSWWMTLATVISPSDLDLQQPTPDKPQIPLPSNTQYGNGGLVEGLVAVRDPRQRRPSVSATLLLTVSYQDIIVAGAKLPLSAVRFPFRFTIQPDNLLVSRQVWNQNFAEQDLLITARVCRGEVALNNCDEDDTFPAAQGQAKLLRFESTIVRAPVSLVL